MYIAMYHYTRDLAHSRYPGIKGLDVTLFRDQIRFFKEHFTIVRMEQVTEAIREGTALPEDAVLLTFDDGYIDHYTFAFPILEEAGARRVHFSKYGLAYTKFIQPEKKELEGSRANCLTASLPRGA